VVTNFNDRPQRLDLTDLRNRDHFGLSRLRDAISGVIPARVDNTLVVPPYGHYWLLAER